MDGISGMMLSLYIFEQRVKHGFLIWSGEHLALKSILMQERFKVWESSGVNIVPVLSQPGDSWTGERGYVQVVNTFISRKLVIHLLCVYPNTTDFAGCFS